MRFGYRYRLGSGTICLLIGICLQLQGMHIAISTAVMAAGMVFIVRGFRTMKHGEGAYRGDERTRKIGALALSYSWFFTLMAIAVLFWLDYLGIMVMSVQHVLAVLLMLMVFTMIGFRWYLSARGDVR
jgi:hypothetical protein